ncbi:hypothetical protein EKH79_14085 [Dyella dinghuensis]|uniref:Uncharacterized protein n=1 Tax=Dyella dinghuensis TaxID=1920169 RepID=A0A432LQ22_9GAMM|nr:hypothetical protein [Dyella dinghuensis]RUL62040.1 hypothetical protein EKH79_14085 [Dyella dinghuensis]
MSLDQQVDGPSRDERDLVYANAGMSEKAIRHAENMVCGSAGRKVGKGALTNVVTRLDSLKNRGPRMMESHTCELVKAYELEHDPDVIGYYTQVPCQRIERLIGNYRRHVTSAHLDFMVFHKDRVELVECKPDSWLTRKITEEQADWQKVDGVWQHGPYQNFATAHELSFSVWTPPDPPGVYLQNLEAMYGVKCCSAHSGETYDVNAVMRAIQKRPYSINELMDEFEGFTARTALWILSMGLVHGPIKSTPILMTDRFILYSDLAQAAIVDMRTLDQVGKFFSKPEIIDPILRATSTDVQYAHKRYALIEQSLQQDVPLSVRRKKLAKDIERAVEEGMSPLSACLTNYGKCGNRISRIGDEREELIEDLVIRLWNTGVIKALKKLYGAFKDECGRRGIEACGRTAFDKRVHRHSPLAHALATGGFRGYQAARPATDPSKRSLIPIAYGHTLHIDSSDLDNRSAPDIAKLMPAGKGKFYVGVDGCSTEVMAHAFIFGPARTDGLAILLRDYVRRHGRLPHLIHVDRGPENRSLWIEVFADGYMSLRWSPSAGSAWNGIAENVIKQVNHQVAHAMIGSTEPDQKGRHVDGRFKSYKNAKTSFETLREQFLVFLYEDFPNSPRGDGMTPLEAKAEAIAALGVFGVPCDLNDDFLIRTAVPVELKKRLSTKRGLRTEDGWFTSDALIRGLRSHDIVELRSDCEDPTILYAKLGGEWIKAFHSKAQSLALMTPSEKLFESMYAPIRRAEARRRLDEIGRKRNTRIELANYATTLAQPAASNNLPIKAQEPDIVDESATSEPSTDVVWAQLEACVERGGRS